MANELRRALGANFTEFGFISLIFTNDFPLRCKSSILRCPLSSAASEKGKQTRTAVSSFSVFPDTSWHIISTDTRISQPWMWDADAKCIQPSPRRSEIACDIRASGSELRVPGENLQRQQQISQIRNCQILHVLFAFDYAIWGGCQGLTYLGLRFVYPSRQMEWP